MTKLLRIVSVFALLLSAIAFAPSAQSADCSSQYTSLMRAMGTGDLSATLRAQASYKNCQTSEITSLRKPTTNQASSLCNTYYSRYVSALTSGDINGAANFQLLYKNCVSTATNSNASTGSSDCQIYLNLVAQNLSSGNVSAAVTHQNNYRFIKRCQILK